jgi:putative ABC transport system permease protein
MNDSLLQDLRVGARSFLRTPRFTVPAVLALALGIGATTAIFSVIRGVVLNPLPYPDPDGVVVIWEHNIPRNRSRNVIGPANFVAWKERNRSFEYLGMVGPARRNMALDGQPVEVPGLFVSSEALLALGVQPFLGRLYNGAEDLEGSDPVILLSYEFWQTRFGGRRDILDVSIPTNGRLRRVVGVMPQGFTVEGQRADYLVPYEWTIEALRSAAGRGSSHGVARLKVGVSFEQAVDDMKTIAAQLEKEAPQRNTGWSVTLVPVHEQTVGDIRPALMVLAGAVSLVLLIACVNVANLLLARSTIRQRELGLRTALGARRGRLVRQMLSESLVLAAAGGALGLALAFAFHRGLIALVADRIPVPRLDQVALDAPVLAFAAAIALGTGLLFGIVPAIVATATASDSLREGGRHGAGPRSRRVLGTLVVAEVALSLVLLTGAGLLIRSFVRLQSISPGFRSEGVLTSRVSLPGARYSDSKQTTAFFDDVVARIRALPGVTQAAGVSFLPMAGPGIGTSFYRLDQAEPAPGQAPVAEVRPVTPGFFRTMGMTQLAGRDFTEADGHGSPIVTVVTETLVRRQFPGENPLGRQIYVNIGPPGGLKAEIVGVVGDIKFSTLDAEARNGVFLPHTQLPIGLMTFVVRTDLDPLSLAPSVAAAVHQRDPELPLADVRTLDDVVSATLARPRAVSLLLTAFALIALVLAAVGVYGVMAYSVSQRTQEIGVRMALGATRESVFRLVLGQALKLVIAGVAVGLVAAALLTQALTTLLYATEPLDPATFVATSVVLLVVATLASYVPARRGTRIAPVEALRTE